MTYYNPAPRYQSAAIPHIYSSGFYYQALNQTQLLIGQGQCRDDSNSFDMVLESAQMLNLTSLGVVNGLDLIPSVIARQAIYLFCIGDSGLRNPTMTYASFSSNNPVMPSGYNLKRRIGSVMTNPVTTAPQMVLFNLSGDSTTRIVNYIDTAGNLAIFNGSGTTIWVSATNQLASNALIAPATALSVMLAVTVKAPTNALNVGDYAYFYSLNMTSVFSPATTTMFAISDNGGSSVGSGLSAGTTQLLTIGFPRPLAFKTTSNADTLIIQNYGYSDPISY